MLATKTHDVFAENWRAIDENLISASTLIELAEAKNFKKLKTIANASLFLSIFNYDLSVICYELTILNEGWRKSFHARVAALLVVEFMEDVGDLTGKDFRAAIVPLLTAEENQKFHQILQILNVLKKKHEKDFRRLRNVAIGHRDRNASLQLQIIRETKADLISSTVYEVIDWVTLITRFFTGLFDKLIMKASQNSTLEL
jgi:hypothetical protein